MNISVNNRKYNICTEIEGYFFHAYHYIEFNIIKFKIKSSRTLWLNVLEVTLYITLKFMYKKTVFLLIEVSNHSIVNI